MFKRAIILIVMTLGSTSYAQNESLNGTYDMKLNIGGTIFNDVMEITEATLSTFKGSITVPGQFTASIEQGRTICSFWANGCHMNFYIVAKENGKEFTVYYQADYEPFNTSAEFKGKAYLENNVLLGEFVVLKRNTQP